MLCFELSIDVQKLNRLQLFCNQNKIKVCRKGTVLSFSLVNFYSNILNKEIKSILLYR